VNRRAARKLRLRFGQPLPPRLLRFLPPLLAALALTLGLVVAGCGGSDSSGEDVDKALSETFGGDKQIKSGKLDMRVTADIKGVPQIREPVSIKIGGPFESRGDNQVPKLDLDLTAESGGQSFTAGVLSTGEKGYLSFQNTDYELDDRIFQQFKREFRKAQNDQTDVPSLTALGVNPRAWMKAPSDEGTDDVNGVETIHISSDIDVPKMLEDVDDLLGKAGRLGLSQTQQQQLPREIPPSVKKQIADAVKTAKVDVYTGKDDKILRKLDATLKFDVPQSLRSQTAGVSSGKVDFALEVADLNKPQEINAPKQAKKFRELQRLLGGGGTSSLGASTPRGG
jgi:hypothetical protein